MKRPNFIIAGAPRCGTTALYTYLGDHPNIFLPEIKELHYFAYDFPDVQKIKFKSIDDYLKMFSGSGSHHLAVGEVSPLYYYSKVAMQNIRDFDPDMKIILILRNPVDFVESVHQLNLGLLREDQPDLAKAWELQESRRQGKNLAASCREPELVFYDEMGLFGKHVERILDVFPRGQVLVILFDDFTADPGSSYKTILSFLGVPYDGRTDFPRVNSSYEHKSRFLAMLIHPPQIFYRLFIKLISLFGAGFMRTVSLIYNKVEMSNVRRVPRSPMEPALRARLQAYFRDDILKLARLIDRDLSAWLPGDGRSQQQPFPAGVSSTDDNQTLA